MTKIFKHLIILLHFAVAPLFSQGQEPYSRQPCEGIMEVTLDKLTPLIDKNDYSKIEPLLNTIQASCGENEFTQRLRILRALIEKNTTGELIADYLSKNYAEDLVMRWDYSVEEEYKSIYLNNKSDFDYIPLNHPIDSLIKLKAAALLYSTSYNLTEQEEAIALLFADEIDEFYETLGYEAPAAKRIKSRAPQDTKIINERTDQSGQQEAQLAAQPYYKDRGGFNIYAGAEFPITGTDPLFKTNPTFGFMYSSKLSTQILYELGLKVRINTADREFDYDLDGEVETVNSGASYSIGGNLGYKLFDNTKFIIFPKVGLFWDITSTGLTEVTDGFYDPYYEDEYLSPSSIRFNSVNTMRTSLALTLMRQLIEKKYVGIELAYHYIPYNWDGSLISKIQPNYSSAQLFFRF